MKLSFSTNAFTRFPLLQAIRRIAAAGYEGVEILADTPHLFPPSLTVAEIDPLRSLLKETGLRVANINANTAVGYYGREFWEPLFEPSLANPVESERKWRIDYTRRCIELADLLGSPSVSITSGRLVPGTSPKRSLDLFKRSIEELIPHAEEHKVRLGIEYEPGLLIENSRELVSLLQEVNTPFLGANLDLGHSHVLGEDLEVVLQDLSGKVIHIHVEDILQRKHYHLIPGEGDMDFSRIFRLLNHHSYDGFVSVELYTYPQCPDDAARRSMDHLQSILRRCSP
jgi:sugar phosphate isomerase/epimerase